MDIEFSSVKELYDRLTPALKTKEQELKRNNINYIKKEDIWNYLKITKWKGAKNLLLHQMVDDILNVDYVLLKNYVVFSALCRTLCLTNAVKTGILYVYHLCVF